MWRSWKDRKQRGKQVWGKTWTGVKSNPKEQGRKADNVVALPLTNNTKNCSSITVQVSTQNTFTLQLSQMKIYQEKKRGWRTVGGSITVNRFNSKLLNEINLVFVVYSRLATPNTNTFCFLPESCQCETLPMPFWAHVLSAWCHTNKVFWHVLKSEVYKLLLQRC